MPPSRGRFATRAGVILASAGSAIGLGNIWRFPTELGSCGGAAFLLVYLLFVFALALPVMVSEFVIGRTGKANTVDAFRRLAPRTAWFVVGYTGVLGGLMVLSFYSVVSAWTLRYTCDTLLLRLGLGHSTGDYAALFQSFVASPFRPLLYLLLFLLATHLIVARGVGPGIERFSRFMMPMLLVIIVVLVGYSLTMPGASEGLHFLFRPDFSRLTPSVVLSAMGQAFFSLSVGIGCLLTYASYFDSRVPLVRSAMGVCLLDTMVAILSGLIIFPAVFSAGIRPDAGPGLVFITLPRVFDSLFASLPLVGYVFTSLFYLLLLLAALTSSISMHEIATAFVCERFSLTRRVGASAVTLLCLVLGAACSLSFGEWSGVRIFGLGFFDLFDHLTAKFIMPLGGLAITVFVGWRMKSAVVLRQLGFKGRTPGHGAQGRAPGLGLRLLMILIRWVAPIGVAVVFLNQLLS